MRVLFDQATPVLFVRSFRSRRPNGLTAVMGDAREWRIAPRCRADGVNVLMTRDAFEVETRERFPRAPTASNQGTAVLDSERYEAAVTSAGRITFSIM
jgi:hypothetical protein